MKVKGIKSGVSDSTKRIAKQAAKQVVGEPFEILKTAGKQVSGAESVSGPIHEVTQRDTESKEEKLPLDEQKIKVKSKRLLEALEKEIEDIRKQKEFDEEEKLKEEEIQEQIQEEEGKDNSIPVISSKPAMGAIKGMKGKLKKLKAKAEIRMPPSG
ncbi:hypothetical protein KKH23_01450 [Patescibacteria group bacterium]|nr:hypothetical protein [Patescibacteria group bacterium]MBU0777157.1 hypothetical protein [Patescibacteria group bacterium]MBU0845851.1 hypothetical protein [Patescibacteria group bacterium]MBU0922878.1 hypothetical protein [Patescibacteria group bacterium]MBU1066389.1 hypothetical protein [Patescibacteria group bacterium]